MFVVIGKFEDTKGKLEACRIYDTETKQYRDVSYGKVRDAIINRKNEVKGFEILNSVSLVSENVIRILKKEKGRFSFNKVVRLNGSGELIDGNDSDVLTVIGWQGFLENKAHVCVDYKGDIKKVKVPEFLVKVKEGKINGATLSPKKDRAIICETLNYEV